MIKKAPLIVVVLSLVFIGLYLLGASAIANTGIPECPNAGSCTGSGSGGSSGTGSGGSGQGAGSSPSTTVTAPAPTPAPQPAPVAADDTVAPITDQPEESAETPVEPSIAKNDSNSIESETALSDKKKNSSPYVLLYMAGAILAAGIGSLVFWLWWRGRKP